MNDGDKDRRKDQWKSNERFVESDDNRRAQPVRTGGDNDNDSDTDDHDDEELLSIDDELIVSLSDADSEPYEVASSSIDSPSYSSDSSYYSHGNENMLISPRTSTPTQERHQQLSESSPIVVSEPSPMRQSILGLREQEGSDELLEDDFQYREGVISLNDFGLEDNEIHTLQEERWKDPDLKRSIPEDENEDDDDDDHHDHHHRKTMATAEHVRPDDVFDSPIPHHQALVGGPGGRYHHSLLPSNLSENDEEASITMRSVAGLNDERYHYEENLNDRRQPLPPRRSLDPPSSVDEYEEDEHIGSEDSEEDQSSFGDTEQEQHEPIPKVGAAKVARLPAAQIDDQDKLYSQHSEDNSVFSSRDGDSLNNDVNDQTISMRSDARPRNAARSGNDSTNENDEDQQIISIRSDTLPKEPQDVGDDALNELRLPLRPRRSLDPPTITLEHDDDDDEDDVDFEETDEEDEPSILETEQESATEREAPHRSLKIDDQDRWDFQPSSDENMITSIHITNNFTEHTMSTNSDWSQLLGSQNGASPIKDNNKEYVSMRWDSSPNEAQGVAGESWRIMKPPPRPRLSLDPDEYEEFSLKETEEEGPSVAGPGHEQQEKLSRSETAISGEYKPSPMSIKQQAWDRPSQVENAASFQHRGIAKDRRRSSVRPDSETGKGDLLQDDNEPFQVMKLPSRPSLAVDPPSSSHRYPHHDDEEEVSLETNEEEELQFGDIEQERQHASSRTEMERESKHMPTVLQNQQQLHPQLPAADALSLSRDTAVLNPSPPHMRSIDPPCVVFNAHDHHRHHGDDEDVRCELNGRDEPSFTDMEQKLQPQIFATAKDTKSKDSPYLYRQPMEEDSFDSRDSTRQKINKDGSPSPHVGDISKRSDTRNVEGQCNDNGAWRALKPHTRQSRSIDPPCSIEEMLAGKLEEKEENEPLSLEVEQDHQEARSLGGNRTHLYHQSLEGDVMVPPPRGDNHQSRREGDRFSVRSNAKQEESIDEALLVTIPRQWARRPIDPPPSSYHQHHIVDDEGTPLEKKDGADSLAGIVPISATRMQMETMHTDLQLDHQQHVIKSSRQGEDHRPEIDGESRSVGRKQDRKELLSKTNTGMEATYTPLKLDNQQDADRRRQDDEVAAFYESTQRSSLKASSPKAVSLSDSDGDESSFGEIEQDRIDSESESETQSEIEATHLSSQLDDQQQETEWNHSSSLNESSSERVSLSNRGIDHDSDDELSFGETDQHIDDQSADDDIAPVRELNQSSSENESPSERVSLSDRDGDSEDERSFGEIDHCRKLPVSETETKVGTTHIPLYLDNQQDVDHQGADDDVAPVHELSQSSCQSESSLEEANLPESHEGQRSLEEIGQDRKEPRSEIQTEMEVTHPPSLVDNQQNLHHQPPEDSTQPENQWNQSNSQIESSSEEVSLPESNGDYNDKIAFGEDSTSEIDRAMEGTDTGSQLDNQQHFYHQTGEPLHGDDNREWSQNSSQDRSSREEVGLLESTNDGATCGGTEQDQIEPLSETGRPWENDIAPPKSEGDERFFGDMEQNPKDRQSSADDPSAWRLHDGISNVEQALSYDKRVLPPSTSTGHWPAKHDDNSKCEAEEDRSNENTNRAPWAHPEPRAFAQEDEERASQITSPVHLTPKSQVEAIGNFPSTPVVPRDPEPSEMHDLLDAQDWTSLLQFMAHLRQGSPTHIAYELSKTNPVQRATVVHRMVERAPMTLTKLVVSMIPFGSRHEILLLPDLFGNTPLHLACVKLQIEEKTKTIDEGVIMTLGVGAPVAHTIKNQNGDVPVALLLASTAYKATTDPELVAVESRAKDLVRKILKDQPDLASLRNNQDQTLLHIGAANGVHERVLNRLLDCAKFMASISDAHGRLPLHYVALSLCSPYPPITFAERLLMVTPEALTAPCSNGNTPLHLLVSNIYTNILNEADRVSFGIEQLTETLLGRFNVESMCPLLVKNIQGMTPLHCCALCSAPAKVVEILMRSLFAKEAINMLDIQKNTPIHILCGSPSIGSMVEQIRLMGTAESSVKKDADGRTPLHVAVENPMCTRKALQAVIDINPQAAKIENLDGRLPLHVALRTNPSEEMIRALILANPKAVKSKFHGGNGIGHEMCEHKTPSHIVELIMTVYPEGAKHANKLLNLPLHVATVYRCDLATIKALVNAYPEACTAYNKNMETPLHYASTYKTSVDIAQYLIQVAPAAATMRNEDGLTPMDYCRQNGTFEIVSGSLDASTQKAPKSKSKLKRDGSLSRSSRQIVEVNSKAGDKDERKRSKSVGAVDKHGRSDDSDLKGEKKYKEIDTDKKERERRYSRIKSNDNNSPSTGELKKVTKMVIQSDQDDVINDYRSKRKANAMARPQSLINGDDKVGGKDERRKSSSGNGPEEGGRPQSVKRTTERRSSVGKKDRTRSKSRSKSKSKGRSKSTTIREIRSSSDTSTIAEEGPERRTTKVGSKAGDGDKRRRSRSVGDAEKHQRSRSRSRSRDKRSKDKSAIKKDQKRTKSRSKSRTKNTDSDNIFTGEMKKSKKKLHGSLGDLNYDHDSAKETGKAFKKKMKRSGSLGDLGRDRGSDDRIKKSKKAEYRKARSLSPSRRKSMSTGSDHRKRRKSMVGHGSPRSSEDDKSPERHSDHKSSKRSLPTKSPKHRSDNTSYHKSPKRYSDVKSSKEVESPKRLSGVKSSKHPFEPLSPKRPSGNRSPERGSLEAIHNLSPNPSMTSSQSRTKASVRSSRRSVRTSDITMADTAESPWSSSQRTEESSVPKKSRSSKNKWAESLSTLRRQTEDKGDGGPRVTSIRSETIRNSSKATADPPSLRSRDPTTPPKKSTVHVRGRRRRNSDSDSSSSIEPSPKERKSRRSSRRLRSKSWSKEQESPTSSPILKPKSSRSRR